MACKICGDSDNDVQIIEIKSNPQVLYGDKYIVRVTIKDTSWLFGGYSRVCLFEEMTGELLGSSSSIELTPGEEVEVSFTGVMPNKDLLLKASVVIEKLYYFEECSDAETFTIKLAPSGGTTLPPENTDPEDSNFVLWLQENYMIVLIGLVLVLVGIKLMRR